MHDQRRVAEFIEEHDLHAEPVYRLLDLSSEVGELAKDAAVSTDYGSNPDDLRISEDELGDALFALLALANSLDLDASDALATAISKYEARLDETGSVDSGA